MALILLPVYWCKRRAKKRGDDNAEFDMHLKLREHVNRKLAMALRLMWIWKPLEQYYFWGYLAHT